jgi:hypothetical protein
MEYEDALVGYFRDVIVGYEKIGGLPWTEIDFMEDVTKADGMCCRNCSEVCHGLGEGAEQVLEI